MFEVIKEQFYAESIKELRDIIEKLSLATSGHFDGTRLVSDIFFATHQITGTGPMLGFEETAKISKQIEKIFGDYMVSKKDLTPLVIHQTSKEIELMINTMNQEYNRNITTPKLSQ